MPLNSIWVRNESGSFELFLRRLEDKMKDGTWHEAAAGIKSIEVVDDENLNSCRVDNARFLRQMLRFSRALERLTALSVFKSEAQSHRLCENLSKSCVDGIPNYRLACPS